MTYKNMIGPDPIREPIVAPNASEQDKLDTEYLHFLQKGNYPSGSVYEFLYVYYRNQETEHIKLIEQGRAILDRLSDDGLIFLTPYGAKLTANGRRYLADI
ncbi:hypothetical protein [Arsenicibacter rosenii]|uniref:Uncharacterized protein n=1 Tax=Arsenicibacter rosenii TaxID=1750698 RepID=A0A1S2VDM5_9BACT|nr:hypothetical protein [Arsenicibacter rosenii]OIN56813.1 hypothetical protein BLX24_22830 [Arsenicibacter rosenii]